MKFNIRLKGRIKRLLEFTLPGIANILSELKTIASFANSSKNGKWYYAGNEIIFTSLYSGQIIAVDRRDISLSPHLILNGIWEMPLTKHCEKIVMRLNKPIIFDIGANFGWYGLILSRLSSESKIHFFEANPNLINLIQKTTLVNGIALRSKINNCAVSNYSDQLVNLSIPSMHKGSASILNFNVGLESYHERPEDVETITISTMTLDHYCIDNSIEMIDFLKIDVEGAEGNVIYGAKEIISRSPHLTIMMEWNRGCYPDAILLILKQFAKCECIADDDERAIDLTVILQKAQNIKDFEDQISLLLPKNKSWFDLFFHKTAFD